LCMSLWTTVLLFFFAYAVHNLLIFILSFSFP